MAITAGNQSINSASATALTLPTRTIPCNLVIRNNTASSFYFGIADTITNSSTNACVIPAGKDHILVLGVSDTIYLYQASGGALRIDWSLDIH